jgi:hypothetical protein
MIQSYLYSIQKMNSKNAAYWLQSGGFSWWNHRPAEVCVSDDEKDIDEEKNPQSKPTGLRKNRKRLAAEKSQQCGDFSDNSSDEDCVGVDTVAGKSSAVDNTSVL